MKEKDIKLGAVFATDVSFFDNADERTKMRIRCSSEKFGNKVLCRVTDVHYSLYDTSYFAVSVLGKLTTQVVVPFGNDISDCELVLSQENAAEISQRAKAYMDAMVVNNENNV